MAGGGSKKLDYQGRAFSDSDLQELPLKDVAYPYEEVNFSQNRLSAEGLRKVLELCSRCERLRILKLYKNDINDDAAQALSRFIRTCYSLEELHLSHNRFTERGVEMLVKAAQEARYEVDGGAPMWMRLEQNEVLNPDQVLGDLQHRYSVCSKRNRTKCSNRFCMHNCKVHLPHFHFQRDEYGHANNEGPRKRKWEAQEAHPRPTEDPWKDTDWRDGRDDWFDGRPQVRNWEEDWEGPPSERPAGMKMSGGIFARAMGAIVRKDEDDGRGDVEPSKRRAVPKNVASRTLSQLGVLAEPRKSKVMLKEAPKGVKELEEEEAQASEDKDEDEEEDDEEVEGEVEERGRPSRGMAKAERRGPGQISRDRRDTERTERRAPTGRRQREHSRRHREEGRREAMHRRAPERETRETRDRRRGAEREREQREPREHRSRSRQRRHQRERSRERRRAEARDGGDRGERRKDRKDREGRRNAERRNAEASPRRQERQTSERPRRRDERAAAGERTEKLLEKIQGSREKRESKATKQEPNDVNKAPPFVATRAKAAPRRPATTTAPPPRPKGTAGAGTAARVPAVAAPKVAAKAKAVADGNESEYTYTEASEYTYEDVEGEGEEEAVEVEDDEDDE